MSALTEILVAPDRTAALRLLESASLPTSDLLDADMSDFLRVGPVNAPIAIVGLQRYGEDALLRSLVVSEEYRTHGLGRALVDRAEQHARERGVTTIYLLTTTAESFFLARGYGHASRESAPPAIRATPEFAGLCPSSSAFLSKRL